ncbi:MAG: GDP-L-fucose synthase, partial [Candidatus Omnitrophica bacterium]|nr:GDP-L-fucose synthase [Candidatus Omnitrophota bacterium]
RELDLTDQRAVNRFFERNRPDFIFLLAARVGGIMANDRRPVDFIYPNLLIECNVMHCACRARVKRLLFLACACVYPRDCRQPMKEEYLLTGYPEPTNVAHAVAKISGIVLCRSFNKQFHTDFIPCVAANIFGPHDNFDPLGGHVAAGLIRKFHEAKCAGLPKVVLWGTGKPRRDFIFVDDVADACMFIIKRGSPELVNISAGSDVSIKELAQLVKGVVGYKGKIEFDPARPDGMPRKLLDSTRLSSRGWKPKTDIKKGLEITYQWYVSSAYAGNRR